MERLIELRCENVTLSKYSRFTAGSPGIPIIAKTTENSEVRNLSLRLDRLVREV